MNNYDFPIYFDSDKPFTYVSCCKHVASMLQMCCKYVTNTFKDNFNGFIINGTKKGNNNILENLELSHLIKFVIRRKKRIKPLSSSR